MASTIDKLQTKYAGRVQRYMENDAYYQYLLEMIAGGQTTITQHNRVLDKSVDETWLEAIEAAVPAIHEIIAHPRKFLKTNENLVPVEQAKRIGTETVRHLASHTQYISGVRGGMVYPGKVLTVENDESIDLYENRFVSTLIRKVAEFIEKRTGAIFWDTGDEEQSILKVESNVEDDYEEISYKLEMVIKNKQTYLENDGSKMDVFKRIDRVRRVVSDFRASTFMQVMINLPTVRSPIQRTNMITKNPHYRACYELWQFLERYDQVGYQIDVRETVLDFDEDYLFQMYGNVAMNYTVFKSLLEHDHRRITETPKKRKTVKPKFIKQIVEQFVDDYDIPDVEIRQVIIEEVAKAQMEIDRRTREKEGDREKQRKAKEKEKAKLAAQKAKEKEKAKLAAQREKEKLAAQKAKEKERAKLAAQKAKEKEQAKLAAQKEKERLAAQREKEKLAAEKAKEKEQAKLAAQKAKEKEQAKLAAQKEKEKLAAQREKEKLAAEKAKAKKPAKPATPEAQEKKPAKPAAPKGSAPKAAAPKVATPKTADRETVKAVSQAPVKQPAPPKAATPKPVTPKPVTPKPVPEVQPILEVKAVPLHPAETESLFGKIVAEPIPGGAGFLADDMGGDPTRILVGRPDFILDDDQDENDVPFLFPSFASQVPDELGPIPAPPAPPVEAVVPQPEAESLPEEVPPPPPAPAPVKSIDDAPAATVEGNDLKRWIEKMKRR